MSQQNIAGEIIILDEQQVAKTKKQNLITSTVFIKNTNMMLFNDDKCFIWGKNSTDWK